MIRQGMKVRWLLPKQQILNPAWFCHLAVKLCYFRKKNYRISFANCFWFVAQGEQR